MCLATQCRVVSGQHAVTQHLNDSYPSVFIGFQAHLSRNISEALSSSTIPSYIFSHAYLHSTTFLCNKSERMHTQTEMCLNMHIKGLQFNNNSDGIHATKSSKCITKQQPHPSKNKHGNYVHSWGACNTFK